MQLGIDVDWYHYRNQDVVNGAAKTVSYVVGLHANAISISFPFYMSGKTSDQVFATAGTPSPDQLAILVVDAKKAGLTVSLRPLLDESTLGESRLRWTPSDPTAWFQSYEQFLRPYLVMSQKHGVAAFIEAAELTQFDTDPGWGQFNTWARSLYHGTLACAANWSRMPTQICAGATETVDAYPPVTHGSLLAGWEAFDRSLRRGTALTEVGIAAAPLAPTNPDRYGWPITQADPEVQGQWFSAACHAAAHEHLSGIYYWSIGLGKQPHLPTVQSQETWSAGPGANAISSCFASLSKDKR